MKGCRDDSGPFPVWEVTAPDEEGRRRLQRRMAVIDALRHPGLVAPASPGGDEPGRLRTRWVGPDLAHLGRRLEAAEVAGLGAAVATTLADLHSLGWVHGAVSAEHILVDPDGRPVLCGLGSARRAGGQTEAASDADALVPVLLALAPRAGPGARELRRVLERARRARLGRVPTASDMAGRLSAPVLGARLPGPASGPVDVEDSSAPGVTARDASGRRGRRQQGRRRVPVNRAAVIALAAVAAAAGGAAVATRPPARRAACPVADRGCRPVPGPPGVVVAGASRFKISPAGAVVMGRWDCGPAAFPALLEVGSGRIWVFDAWAAPGRPRAARLVAAVPGASSLTVLPGSDGCDRLGVLRSSGPAEVVSPQPGRGRG